ncbi:hypothetical protein B0T25DRAFT_451645 [Lasiosphaeria hispida]|uniref:Fe2OG dioxygenase domain-containing protein n=1 Tax=Lasiosphaeria hispida TaxID=260671 RepID=A0AAJ0HN18_9PEZI|nr:hypothetical protein B0T25DRAFT_451645 [Lasiosphaeria hispida]
MPEIEMPTAPPSKISESPLFKEIRESVALETVAFTFGCGGTVPVVSGLPDVAPEPARSDSGNLRSTSSLPIDLRWDPHDGSTPARQAKLTFPLEPAHKHNLNQLLQDMQPATFGLGGKDVYDESYRKALKLDPTRFSSTLNPYTLGIIDIISQALLPSLRHAKQTRAVKAELYKLNIYSGPSGKFKSHIDTPRSPSQFGSLVINLPLSHSGGALEVRHQGKTLSFDWGNNTAAISWAAFYSDCEHEVLPVTDGHRITLTYNLYCVRGAGQLGGCDALDPRQLPLYQTIRELMHDEAGWEKGGWIGFNCAHVYPHTTSSPLNFVAPDNLKGADMLMYEIFSSMGLEVLFRPVVSNLQYTGYPTEDWEDREPPPLIGQHLQQTSWDMRIENEHGEMYDGWSGKDAEGWTRQDQGSGPRPGFIDFGQVHWLNDFGHEEPQISWIAYGNEESSVMTYSSLAMIVKVPAGGAKNAGQPGGGETTQPKAVAVAEDEGS